MELIPVKEKYQPETMLDQVINETSSENFITANTEPVNLYDLKEHRIIPSFAKDNESTISHTQFIDAVAEMASDFFSKEVILQPSIRVSHPIKGRIPEAMGKPAKDLLDHEKTLYYERMAFIIEIPSIKDTIMGNELSLTIGGVRAYNQENLYSRKIEERFKIFIGFKNKVCTNLCITTDGFIADLRVKNVAEISNKAYELFAGFRYEKKVSEFSALGDVALTEHQFAQMVGKMRLYQYLPLIEKREIAAVPIMDSQVATVAKDYYSNKSFCREENGEINLWKLYNLFTGANKTSYIDTFLDRETGCYQFAQTLSQSILQQDECWFLK